MSMGTLPMVSLWPRVRGPVARVATQTTVQVLSTWRTSARFYCWPLIFTSFIVVIVSLLNLLCVCVCLFEVYSGDNSRYAVHFLKTFSEVPYKGTVHSQVQSCRIRIFISYLKSSGGDMTAGYLVVQEVQYWRGKGVNFICYQQTVLPLMQSYTKQILRECTYAHTHTCTQW